MSETGPVTYNNSKRADSVSNYVNRHNSRDTGPYTFKSEKNKIGYNSSKDRKGVIVGNNLTKKNKKNNFIDNYNWNTCEENLTPAIYPDNSGYSVYSSQNSHYGSYYNNGYNNGTEL